jgi:hypothetical protein
MVWYHTHSFRLFPVSFQLRSSLARIADGGDPPAEFYSLTRQRDLGFPSREKPTLALDHDRCVALAAS